LRPQPFERMALDEKKHMESYMDTMDDVGEEFRRFF
jgi:hypothetical protein